MIFQILDQLAATASRNEKLAIIEAHRDNDTLRTVFEMALNPYRQYFIKKIPPYSPSAQSTLRDELAHLERLSARSITGHAAIDFLSECLSRLSAEDASVLERVIKKDLRCGVQAATVNKVWTDLIPSYPVLLASGFSEKLIEQIQWPAYAQLKLDGMRVNFIVRNKSVESYGRSGKPIDFHNMLDSVFLNFDTARRFVIDDQEDYVYDGELIVLDARGNVMPRKTGNGILNKGIKGTISKEEAARVRVVLWDMIPHKEFLTGKSHIPYSKRFGLLKEIDSRLNHEDTLRPGKKPLELAETRIVHSIDEATDYFEETLSRGEEGIILKDMLGVWEDKRSKSLVKFKAEKEAELEVVEWIEGTGRNKGRLGALTCKSSDNKIVVSIGSGYTDEQRDNITADNIVGRIVTVRYNERISSSGDKPDSLFLPRLIEIREDKEKADHSNTIK